MNGRGELVGERGGGELGKFMGRVFAVTVEGTRLFRGELGLSLGFGEAGAGELETERIEDLARAVWQHEEDPHPDCQSAF